MARLVLPALKFSYCWYPGHAWEPAEGELEGLFEVTNVRGVVADAVLGVVRSAKVDVAEFFGGAAVHEVAARVRTLAAMPGGRRGDCKAVEEATFTELWTLAEAIVSCLNDACDPHGQSEVDSLCTDALLGDEDVIGGLYEFEWRRISPSSLKTWFVASVCGFDGLLQGHLARRWGVGVEDAEGMAFPVSVFTNCTPVNKCIWSLLFNLPLREACPGHHAHMVCTELPTIRHLFRSGMMGGSGLSPPRNFQASTSPEGEVRKSLAIFDFVKRNLMATAGAVADIFPNEWKIKGFLKMDALVRFDQGLFNQLNSNFELEPSQKRYDAYRDEELFRDIDVCDLG